MGGELEAYRRMDKELCRIAETCDCVTAKDMNCLNEMRSFIRARIKELEEEE